MKLALANLNYSFKHKPLLVGGMAMEYYGLRKAGKDIDFIVHEDDILALIKLYPNRIKDLYADLGVCPLNFEIWRSINFFKYDDLKGNAIEEDEYFVISLENLLIMKALAMSKEKYLEDTKLIVKKINDDKYRDYINQRKYLDNLLSDITDLTYIENTGPKE